MRSQESLPEREPATDVHRTSTVRVSGDADVHRTSMVRVPGDADVHRTSTVRVPGDADVHRTGTLQVPADPVMQRSRTVPAPADPTVTGVLALQRSAGNAATAVLLGRLAAERRREAQPAEPSGGDEERLPVQRKVPPGLPARSPVRLAASGTQGVVVEETHRRIGGARVGGYVVRLWTVALPSISFTAFFSYDELDPAMAAATGHGTGDAHSTGTDVTAEKGKKVEKGEEVEKGEAVEEDEEDEEPFDGDMQSLPESVTVGGVELEWTTKGKGNVLKPSSGEDFPHLTFVKEDPIVFHLTVAEVSGDGKSVSVGRRGYAWNGMHQRLQDDPEFPEAQQLLPIISTEEGYASFRLSGLSGRIMRVPLGVKAMKSLTADEMAAALSI